MKAVTVEPAGPLRGDLAIPGDKSVTHRAYLVAALCDGECRVRGANPGEDCRRTLALVRALGVEVVEEAGDVHLGGGSKPLAEPGDVLDCGNSGTTLRLGAGVLAGQPWLGVLSGDASLRQRPVDRVVEPLRRMGATLQARGGDRFPPLVVRGGELRGIRYPSPVASAQVKSCVLLAGLRARGATEVVEPVRSRDHTERLLRWLGVSVAEGEHVGGRHRVALEGPARPQGRRVEVPGDFSAAAFLLAAALLRPGSEVRLRGVGLNPTRAGLLEALARMGAEVRLEEAAPAGEEPRGDVRVTGTSTLRATSIEEREVPALVDEIPIWAVAAACARGRSTLRGAGELRVKESDRLAMLARNLRAVGVAAEERADGLTVEGGRLHGGTVESGGDHRIAMAFAVAGLAAAEPVTVLGIESVGTSFPGFFTALEALGAHCTFHETGPGR